MGKVADTRNPLVMFLGWHHDETTPTPSQRSRISCVDSGKEFAVGVMMHTAPSEKIRTRGVQTAVL